LSRIIYSMALVAFCLLGGCGYHLAGGTHASSLIAGKTIAIPMWSNKTYRPNLEAILTDSLVNEFALRNGGMVVSEDAAELVLTGTIVSYTTVAASYKVGREVDESGKIVPVEKVREYRKTMKVDATLTEKRSEKVLWKGTLSEFQDYPSRINTEDPNSNGLQPENPNSIALQQNSDDAALREICRKIAQQLFQNMSENF